MVWHGIRWRSLQLGFRFAKDASEVSEGDLRMSSQEGVSYDSEASRRLEAKVSKRVRRFPSEGLARFLRF